MSSIELKKYFVYELIDPRNNEVFYVGKGANKRELDHKGNINGTEKEKRIYEIENSGNTVNRVIVARYNTEDEAFAVEAMLIKWVYGYDNLTNIVQGKCHHLVRPLVQKVTGEYMDITGIDREKNISSQTFEYTDKQKSQIEEYNIFEKLEELSQYLNYTINLNVNISEPDISKPQDPHILISGFSDEVQLVIKINLGGGTEVGFSYVPGGPGKSKKEEFENAIIRKMGEIKISKGNIYNTSYVGIKDENNKSVKIPVEDNNKIKENVVALIDRIK